MPVPYERLDAVSVLYPALSFGKRGYVFRLCAVLTEEVDAQLLRESVRALRPRFPILYTHLKKTFFSYAHVPADDLDIVGQEEPCLILPELYDTAKPAFRIYCEGSRIAMDVFHANADAGAAIQYLQQLLADYCSRLEEGAPGTACPASEDELADDYLRNFDRTKNASFAEKRAYRFRLAPDGDYVRLTCISISLSGIKGRIKPEGFTVNDYLTAALYLAIARGVHLPKEAPDVSISVPINLRPFFGSVTQRNFSYYVNVRVPAAAGMEEALRCVHRQVRDAMQRERLLSGIAATVKTANNVFVRFTPRALKEVIIRRVYRSIAGQGLTTTLSNIGFQKPAPAVLKKLVRFEMYLGAGGGGMNASAVGCGERVSMCMSASSRDRCVERAFEELLREDGIAFSVSEQEFRDFKKIREVSLTGLSSAHG